MESTVQMVQRTSASLSRTPAEDAMRTRSRVVLVSSDTVLGVAELSDVVLDVEEVLVLLRVVVGAVFLDVVLSTPSPPMMVKRWL